MKKKILSMILAFFMTVSMFSLMPATADATITAKPTASKVIVNGEEISFDAYLINDNNYFKLRDLAYVLNGTKKQFEVKYDEKTKAISLTSGETYTEVGGEMTGKSTGNKAATPAESKIYLDGKEINLTAYMVEGNNYFKLRDIGQTLNFCVEFDEEKNTVTIDTDRSYPPEGREFANGFRSYFGGTENPDNKGVIKYWDTGKEKIKFETASDEKIKWYVLKINDNKVDMENFLWFDQIIVMEDIIVITTGGTDIRSTPIYIFDFNGKKLFETYYLNNKGMVIQRPVSIEGNKIIMPGTRLTHGIDLVMKSPDYESSEYEDYLYIDTVYNYENSIYQSELHIEVYLDSFDSMSEEAKLLNKDEIIEADFELEYLGGGKFGKIKMTENFTTLKQYFIAIPPVRVNEPANKMSDTELISMLETKLYKNANDFYGGWICSSSGLDLDESITYDTGDSAMQYVLVKDIKNITELKAKCEGIFSINLLGKSVYPWLIEGDYPLFIENDGKLYYNKSTGAGAGYAPDFTRAKVTNKSADSFEIEVPMTTVDDEEGSIFVYKAVEQNGNWVLDSFYYFQN